MFRSFHGIYSGGVGGDNYANVCSNWQLSLLKWHLAAPGYFAVITAALVLAWSPVTAGTQLRQLSVSIITRWNIDFFREGLKFHNHGDTKKAPTRAFSCGWKCLLAHDHKERDGWLQESMLTNQLLVLIVSIITWSPVRWNMKGWIWKRWMLLISLKCKNYFVPLTCLKPILCCWLDFWRYVSREIWRKH